MDVTKDEATVEAMDGNQVEESAQDETAEVVGVDDSGAVIEEDHEQAAIDAIGAVMDGDDGDPGDEDDSPQEEPEAGGDDAEMDALIALGASRGIPEDELRSIGDASQIRLAVRMFDLAKAGSRPAEPAGEPEDLSVKHAQSADKSEAKPAEASQSRDPIKPIEIPENSLIDDDTRSIVDQINERLAILDQRGPATPQMPSDYEQRIAAIEQDFQARAQKDAMDRFDSLVAEHPEWKDVLGDDRTSTLDLSSEAFRLRVSVADDMDALERHYHQGNQPVPSDEQLFVTVMTARFRDRLKQEARREVARSVKKRQGQFTARPKQGNKGASPRTEDEFEAAAIAEIGSILDG